MMFVRNLLLVALFCSLFFAPALLRKEFGEREVIPEGREEVLFWHFWGGKDRKVVEDVVKRFNRSQEKYWVREIAMPGNNLQAKLFLSTTGGDPPDLVNQDDPILADWAQRGIIQPMDAVAGEREVESVSAFLLKSASRLSKYDDRLFAVCNGLDIRALYVNQNALERFGLSAPKSIDELNRIAETISPSGADVDREFYAYLPDSRRLWAWGYVFGGEFYSEDTQSVTLTGDEVRAATDWMAGFAERYGSENIAAFRTGDQSLPGKTFPLLPIRSDSEIGRYVMLMDGQWRTRDICEFNQARRENGLSPVQFDVTPLPCPSGGRENAGWVNGNFFVIPRGAKNSAGAWEFIKFWIGYTDPNEAAKTCVAGGWIPVSDDVIRTQDFQEFLVEDPLFAKFVTLAESPNQFPVPVIPGAPMFKRSVESAAYQAMNEPGIDIEKLLQETESQIQESLRRASRGGSPSK